MPPIPYDPREEAIAEMMKRAGGYAEGMVPEVEPTPEMDPRPRPGGWEMALTGIGDALNVGGQIAQQHSDSGSYHGYRPLEAPTGTRDMMRRYQPDQMEWDRADRRREMAGWGAGRQRDQDVAYLQGGLYDQFSDTGEPSWTSSTEEKVRWVEENFPGNEAMMHWAVTGGGMPSEAAPPRERAPTGLEFRMQEIDQAEAEGTLSREDAKQLRRQIMAGDPRGQEPDPTASEEAAAMYQKLMPGALRDHYGDADLAHQAVSKIIEQFQLWQNPMPPGFPGELTHVDPQMSQAPGDQPLTPAPQWPGQAGAPMPGAAGPTNQGVPMGGAGMGPGTPAPVHGPPQSQMNGPESQPGQPAPAGYLPASGGGEAGLPSIMGGTGMMQNPGMPDGDQKLKTAVQNYTDYINSIPMDDPRRAEKIEEVKKAFEIDYGMSPDAAYDRMWS